MAIILDHLLLYQCMYVNVCICMCVIIYTDDLQIYTYKHTHTQPYTYVGILTRIALYGQGPYFRKYCAYRRCLVKI